jgi:ubiquinone/menaquinone biosynthesis C-methylase UbiE
MTLQSAPASAGAVLHSPRLYDLTVWLATLGRERSFRKRLVQLARLEPGESVLDVGCGTGTLAIAAQRHVGPSGIVHGIDASAEMVSCARAKAKSAGVNARFECAAAQAPPFADATFDAALCTLMLHHIGSRSRLQLACELHRVIKPGGRALVVDFGHSTRGHRGPFRLGHRGHGAVALGDISELLERAGFKIVESGSVGVLDLHFVLGSVLRGA